MHILHFLPLQKNSYYCYVFEQIEKSSAYYYLLVKAHHVVSLEYMWAHVTCLKTCLKVSQLYNAISLKTRLV